MNGAGGSFSRRSAAAGGVLLDQAEHRGRQDSSQSPLQHENTAGGERACLTLPFRVGPEVL